MQIYIANLGKYNEGELVGAWFTPPIDYEEMQEHIGLNGEYEEYAIHDYELPFNIDEYTPIEEINRLCSIAEELADTSLYHELSELLGNWFSNLEELYEHKDDIICYSDCASMEDLAYEWVEEGLMREIPERMQMYLDYSAIGRDLEINGNFLVTSHGVFEYCN